MNYNIAFIVSGLLALLLTIYTKVLLEEKGFKVSWKANLNQWGQLFQLIKRQNNKADKWKYSILLLFLVFSTLGAVFCLIKA